MEERSDSDTRSKERTVVRRGEEKKKEKNDKKILQDLSSFHFPIILPVYRRYEKLVFRLE